MPRTSDNFPYPPPQQTPSRPAPNVPAAASSEEPRPQEAPSWSQQAFVSPSMSTTTTPVMNWMQAFTTPARASSQHSLRYQQLQNAATLGVQHTTSTNTLSLFAGLTNPFTPTEASNYQTGLPLLLQQQQQLQQHQQEQQHPTQEYPMPSPSMVLSLPSPSYPHTPIPHRPLQKRPFRDEKENVVTHERIAPLPGVSKHDDEEDEMSMTQELLTSPLAESPLKKKRKAPPSSSTKKRKQVANKTRAPPSPKWTPLIQEQAGTLAKKQWKLNQKQNKNVESAGPHQMEMLERENKNPASPNKESASSKIEKLKASRGIVDKIRQRDGKFLFKQNDGTGFYDIGDCRASRKTLLLLQKAEIASLKKYLKSPPHEEELLVQKRARLKKSSNTSPKKKQCVKESPELDSTLLKTVAGILTIPPPLEPPPEVILNTTVLPQIFIPSPLKDWNPPSRVYKNKKPPKDSKPSRCQEQEPYRLFVPPPQIPTESELPDSSNHLKAAGFPQQQNTFFQQRHCQESGLLRPPQIPSKGDLPEIGLPAFEDCSNFSPAASLPVSKLSTVPGPNNRLEPIGFQRYCQEQLRRLLPPLQMSPDGNLPEIASLSFKNVPDSDFSIAAASLAVSKLSTQPNSNNCLEPTEIMQNPFNQQHFPQHYQRDDDNTQDWFRANDSR